MPRQKNRGSQKLGKSENNFKSDIDYVVDLTQNYNSQEKEPFQQPLANKEDALTSFNLSTDILSRPSIYIDEENYNYERNQAINNLTNKDHGETDFNPSPPMTDLSSIEAAQSYAQLQLTDNKITNKATEFPASFNPSQGKAVPISDELKKTNRSTEKYDPGPLSGINKTTERPAVCKSTKITLSVDSQLNAKGHNRRTKDVVISNVMKKILPKLPTIAPKVDQLSDDKNNEHRKGQISSYDECQNVRNHNKQSTYILNFKSAIESLTNKPNDKLKETRKQMTLAPTKKLNVKRIVPSMTPKLKDTAKTTLRQVTELNKREGGASGIKGNNKTTLKYSDKAKTTIGELTEVNKYTDGVITGSLRHKVYSKQKAKTKIGNLNKQIETKLNIKGNEQSTKRYNDKAKPTLRMLTEDKTHTLNAHNLVSKITNYDNTETNIYTNRGDENKYTGPAKNIVNAPQRKDEETTTHKYSDIISMLSGFDKRKPVSSGPSKSIGTDDINMEIKTKVLPSFEDYENVTPLISNLPLSREVIESRKDVNYVDHSQRIMGRNNLYKDRLDITMNDKNDPRKN